MTRRLIAMMCAVLTILPAAGAAIIQEVAVESRGVIIQNREFVLACLCVKAGDEIDQRKISRDIKTLLATGRFTFVDTELRKREDGAYTLVYIVEVKPRLEKAVIVHGNDAYSEKKIRGWLELEVGDPVDDAILSRRARKVVDEYHQRFYPDVEITWKLEIDETTGFTTVHLNVKEGEKASVRKAQFAGNTYVEPSGWERFKAGLKNRRALSDTSVPPEDLEEAVSPHLWHIFSFFTHRGVYNEDDLNSDREAIRTLYLNRGYLDVKVGEPVVQPYKPGKLMSTFPITEGRQYRVGTIRMKGAQVFPETNLWAVVRLKTNDLAAMDLIHMNAAALRDYYQSRGYMRASVKPLLQPQSEGAVVDVEFDIAESSLVNIRYIDIRGNTRTKDKVIRRELLVYPGELYDQPRVKRGERILQNLGFFQSATSYPRETLDPAKDDVVYEVEEGKTGNFMVGAGYSSVDDVIGFVELSQGNFDLFNWPYFTGDGQKLRLRTQFGTQTEDYRISFVEPWFLDRKLSLGVDLYDTDLRNLSSYYNQQTLGGAVTLGKPLKGFFQRVNLRYSLEQIDIYGVATNAVQRIQDDAGSHDVSAAKLTFVHDTRDNVFVPTRGSKISVGGRLSGGPLGFETDMYGFEADSSTYVPLWFDHVFNVRAQAEVVSEYGNDSDVHIFDRLYLGGARSLRGFKYRYVSPYEQEQPIGGKTAAMGNLEYSIPITKKIVRFATFYDIGNVWLDAYDFDLSNYCSDIGIGVRFDVPGFPIRLDYAWPLEIAGDDISRTSARFNFWIGYGF